MFERWKDLLREDGDTLERVSAPTAVTLHAKIASKNALESPLSHHKAAFFEIDFHVEHAVEARDPKLPGYGATIGEHIGTAVLGSDLVLDAPGGTVLLPSGQFVVQFRGVEGHGVRLEGEIPPEFAHIKASPRLARGAPYYRELTLAHGDDVQLVATVAPAPSGAGVSFVARPDLGRVLLLHRLPGIR